MLHTMRSCNAAIMKNHRLATVLSVLTGMNRPEKRRVITPKTSEVVRGYADLQQRALSRLPGWEGRPTSAGWRHRANANARANWHRAKRDGRLPPWADRAEILAIYMRAAMLNLQCDHVYPLHGKRVSGLHVHENLRVITRSDNACKGADSPDAETNLLIRRIPTCMGLGNRADF